MLRSSFFRPDEMRTDESSWQLFSVSPVRFKLRVSSVQYGLLIPPVNSFSPESCRLLLLRSSSFRFEVWAPMTNARDSQLPSDSLQPLSLKDFNQFPYKLMEKKSINIYNMSFSSFSKQDQVIYRFVLQLNDDEICLTFLKTSRLTPNLKEI